uniref:Thioredoxin n=1 Tax=Clostridium acetobutylicum (strain ATCC 824 / DSM 792 / JCM 1419 / IAM 19013 / LMG 5710 / NBRC 13948 / NRRL B-527 / VKM B-1787 / 2291 / W) TaxID=272562 RepID=UPI000F62C137|nr:Chain B, Thioredoxin [Clostridium acetobutylicum ATCC 824]6GND_D Chain D, Thioredoxin [Clostridium acetobutylicum ATCC 824]6GND_F Chain F, Thioredoxin [Clostridium acetobutylicum ATCC 824]6GND_H Chain H, Thioredoxin [Clostridium acetobutylicum ATCC 824]
GSHMVKEINESIFDEEIKTSGEPVIVDFWAPWCGPSKMLGPIIDELSEDLDGKAKFTKVNVDENPGIASKFGIASIPTVMIFKDGNPVETLVGFRPKQSITASIEKHM